MVSRAAIRLLRVLVVSAAFGVPLAAGTLPGAATAAATLAPLTIETASGPHRFEVEVATDEPTRQRGLMFRQSLAPDHGMLFVFPRNEPISMWMKNTYIPLDMVFIRADGRVHRVERDTTPFSERTIESGESVRYVLELPAGTAARIGIARGDRVVSSAIRP